MLRSRRALPDHPDHRPGTFWLAFVTDGTVAQIIEHGPDVATSALVFDPSGFVDDYPVVPVGDLLRLWRTTAVTRAWTWNGSAWRIDHTLYPDVPLRRLLLV
ncbi:hypothetical protein BIU97_07400 [Curtobacterium sp. MCBA15_009]|nr:hypothetical protein BIU92_02480 [Curtobacterium sp. MCBA15_003]OII11685.1 hypothetical protein BIU97_07400 [Curtobacterium sp. MCBA15_009]